MTKSPSYKAVYRINNRLSKRDNIDEIINARIEKEKLLVGRLVELEASLKAKDKLCAFARHLVYIGYMPTFKVSITYLETLKSL